MEKKRIMTHIGHGLMFCCVFLLVVAGVMVLWNALIPSITGWTTINYWQTMGLMVLGRLLTGGFWPSHRSHIHTAHERFHSRFSKMDRAERRAHIRHFMCTPNEDSDQQS